MKENMTTNNKPAFEIFVVREGSNKKSYFTKIGAAWPTKSGSGYNADLIALPVDGKFILLPPKEGAFKQTTQKFHRIFGKPLSIIGFCQFRPSQFSAHSKAGFLGDAASPMESTIRSSEKSNSPCKLKCCQVTAEPWRMASISSARRFSFFSAASSRER